MKVRATPHIDIKQWLVILLLYNQFLDLRIHRGDRDHLGRTAQMKRPLSLLLSVFIFLVPAVSALNCASANYLGLWRV